MATISSKPSFGNPTLEQKFDVITARIRELAPVLVAYSGGVDSTLVLKIGAMAIGDDCIGVTAQSESLADDEFEEAVRIAGDHGMRQELIRYSELAIENYANNPVNRCYLCKHELYTRLGDLAKQFNVNAVLDGTNADDHGDYRPGLEAVQELNVVSVLREADMHKDEIREMARALDLPNWNKPAGACLSSRIPYGEKIDAVKLKQVADGEKFLRGLGFDLVRVRHHDKIARIEVTADEIARFSDPELRDKIVDFMRSIGFQFVTVDLTGYRTGSLNEVIR